MASAMALKSLLNKFITTGNCDGAPNGASGAAAAEAPGEIERTATDLAYCVVDHYTAGLTDFRRSGREAPGCSKTLLRMVDHMSERHHILFSRYLLTRWRLFDLKFGILNGSVSYESENERDAPKISALPNS